MENITCESCGVRTNKRFWLKRDAAKWRGVAADLEAQLLAARAERDALEQIVKHYREEVKNG